MLNQAEEPERRRPGVHDPEHAAGLLTAVVRPHQGAQTGGINEGRLREVDGQTARPLVQQLTDGLLQGGSAPSVEVPPGLDDDFVLDIADRSRELL